MSTSLSRLSVFALSSFASEVIEYSDQKAPGLVANHPLLTVLKSDYALLFAALGKLTYSGKGKEVAQADVNRREMYLSLRFVLRGYAKAKGHSGQKAAKELLRLFDLKGKKVFQDSYLVKSNDMTHLVAALSKPEQLARIEALGLAELVALLKEACAAFDEKYYAQIAANAELHSAPSATSLRKQLELSLRNYLSYIKAMSTVDDNWNLFYHYSEEVAKHLSKGRKNE